MLLSCGANEDGQCGRHDFKNEEDEDGYGNFVDMASSPTRPLSPLRRKSSQRLSELGKLPSVVLFGSPIIIVSVAAGSRHSLALSSDGHVYSWGWGVQGQLGHGQNKTLMAPRMVEFPCPSDNTIVKVIAAGGMHSACVTTSGECYTWGASQYGQLGLGDEVVKEKTCCEPRKVMIQQSSEKVPFLAVSIALGGMHSAAIDIDGKMWCWGRADSGQTGQKEWIFSFFNGLVVPHMVSDIEEEVTMVACGGFHTAAVTISGKLYTMGKEDFGMLGTTLGSETASHVNLVDSLLSKTIVGVSCGGWHTVMWTDDGELFACGKGEYGRLGLGDEASVCEPARVNLGDNVKVKSASAGGSHTLILSTHNEVFSTGRTGGGRLAIGPVNCNRVLEPTKVDLYSAAEVEFVEVQAGGCHSLLIKKLKE